MPKPSIICVRCLFNVASFGEICIACGSPFMPPPAKRKCIRKNTIHIDTTDKKITHDDEN